MALIVPAPGKLKETAQALLALAGDVPEIVRTTQAGNAFEVPDELADAYHDAQDQPVKAASTTSKRRGRAPRATKEE